jgi:hypothetical protein
MERLAPKKKAMVFLPILIDYFNGCTPARNLGIPAQIKI